MTYKTFDFLCSFLPIGALTSKTYAFTARPWELEVKKSVDFFDFFAYPITVYSKGAEVFRITSFDMQFWISDSTRFFVTSLRWKEHNAADSCAKLSFNRSVSKLSWFETALFINSSLFSSFMYSNFGQVLEKKFFNFTQSAQVLRALNLFSVNSFVDLKDLVLLKHIISFIPGNSFSVCPKSFFSVFTRFNVLKTKLAEIDRNISWISTSSNTFDVRYFFVFDSNLRYQAPVLNAKLKFFTNSYPNIKVYLFGKNTSYFFNYSVLYCGDFKSVMKLFAGRFSSISKYFFSKNSVSIFGSEILKFFCKSLTYSVFNRVYENLFKVIFLQSDFTQNSKNIFGAFSTPQFFNSLFFSTFSKSLVNFNFFYFNSKYSFYLPRRAVDFFSLDFKNFIFPKVFKFQTIVKTLGLTTNVFFEPFSWVYNIPTCNFGFTSNSYISLAGKVCKVSKITNSIPFSALVPNYSVLYYIFKVSMFNYMRYRSFYNTFLSYSNIAFYRVNKLFVNNVESKASSLNSSVFAVNNSIDISNFYNCALTCFVFPASVIDIFFSSIFLLYFNNVFKCSILTLSLTPKTAKNLMKNLVLTDFFECFVNIFKSQYYLNIFFLRNNLPSISFNMYTFFFNFFCIPSFKKIYFNYSMNLKMNSFLVYFFRLDFLKSL